MATGEECLAFILDQLSLVDGITSRAMMGEYILYQHGKVAAYGCEGDAAGGKCGRPGFSEDPVRCHVPGAAGEEREEAMKLEKMDAFFEVRLEGYEEHMLENIAQAREFYPFTASLLPTDPDATVLDLGCGTGLELRWYFAQNPTARVTAIDLSQGMLAVLKERYSAHKVTAVWGSYFDLSFGEGVYDAALSVESLHHFTAEEKVPLYRKLHRALKRGGWFILTDYFALSDGEEAACREQLLQLKKEQGLEEGLYHFDTPLTVAHETRALLEAGFASVEVLGTWGATATLKARA